MTVEEVLKQSGMTDEQIKALDQKVVASFTGVLTTAEQERQKAESDRVAAAKAQEAAELAQRSNVDFYENKIAPALTTWEDEKTRLANETAAARSEAALYRTWAEEQKKNGVVTDIPAFDVSKFIPATPAAPQRDDKGRYVANVPGATPGSPTFNVNEVYQRAGDAVGVIADIQWEHQKLFGQPMPISPTELVKQADSVKLDPKTYAARTFNWDVRRQQMQAEAEQKRAEEIAGKAVAPYEQKLKEIEEQHKKELADVHRTYAERGGNNPDVRVARPTQYADVQRAIKANELPDPLMLNDQQRNAMTRSMIRKDIAESAA